MYFTIVVSQRFELRLTEPKSAVLPLYYETEKYRKLDSNQRPNAYEAPTLPTELSRQIYNLEQSRFNVYSPYIGMPNDVYCRYLIICFPRPVAFACCNCIVVSQL